MAAYKVKGETTFGIQFHPEVTHSLQGKELLKNFVVNICECSQDWTPDAFVETTVKELKNKILELKQQSNRLLVIEAEPYKAQSAIAQIANSDKFMAHYLNYEKPSFFGLLRHAFMYLSFENTTTNIVFIEGVHLIEGGRDEIISLIKKAKTPNTLLVFAIPVERELESKKFLVAMRLSGFQKEVFQLKEEKICCDCPSIQLLHFGCSCGGGKKSL